MRRHILLSEVEGKPSVCFDTGLEPRSFARTKMSQSLIEKGYTVNPNGTHEVWTSSGVCEFNNHMRVWGKPFSGERFDSILSASENGDEQKQTTLNAIVHWIKAKMFLGDTYTTLNSAATFINQDGSVFFSPPNLSNRCLHVEGMEYDFFNCPDLMGMDAAAFCAAAMLYKTLTKTLPYSNKETLYQDMREGVFLPPHIAAPNLNKELCSLIQAALCLPVTKKTSSYKKKDALDILNQILSLLTENSNSTIQVSLLFNQLSAEENRKHEKERKNYLFKQKVLTKTKRFTARNKYPIIGSAIGVFFILFVIFSTMDGLKKRPTTEGMLPDSVVFVYYNAFNSLDHILMEASSQGSDPVIKSDINAITTYYAILKTRQSYENTSVLPFISARAWKESGGELPAPDVFGITDITFDHIEGNEYDNMIVYRANYLLWSPNEHARERTDTLFLRRDRKKNWRITEILRTER